MDDVIFIANQEIVNIPIIECGESLIDIKNSHEIQYGAVPECELTQNDYTKMRKTIFEKLCRAQVNLPHRWKFRLYEGYRSLRVQEMLFEQEYARVVQRYPHKTNEFYFHETTRVVSPVINLDGTQNIPPHNTGAAVDIEIISDKGDLIDMGMAVKDWSIIDPALFATNCKSVSLSVQQNRKMLLEVMEKEGFVNYPTEWWHFSYGDRYWAYHQPVKKAIFGSISE
jgi:D-alanyl-D-alanine dipeptidase